GPAGVIYLDNEGQFRVTGPTLVDHLAWKDYEGEFKEALSRFAGEHGLPAPLTKAAREKAVRGIPTPETLLEAAKKAGQKRAATAGDGGGKPAKAKPAAKAEMGASVAKGPRPLCRMIVVGIGTDGTLYTLSGEDYGGAYGDKLTKGATFRFDVSTSSFVRLSRQPQGEYGMPLAHWPCFPFAPEACIVNDAWLERGGVEMPPTLAAGFDAHRLSDGTWLVTSGSVPPAVYHYAKGVLTAVGALPEQRNGDKLVELADGRFLLAGGQRNYESLMSTVLVDVAKRAFVRGPDLPGPHGLFGGDRRGRAFLVHGYRDSAEKPPTLSVFDGTEWASHPAPAALFHPTHGSVFQPICPLASGEVLLHSWRDMALATLDLEKRTVTPAGRVRTNASGARGFELTDGRVLFVGGTLFNNLDAEPEIWDPATRTTSCLPGYDKEAAKQEKELAKYRAKKGY
ncbi:MAG: hypothetical protein WCJ30_19805, partial [Deltaproteobacteria bacterium]